MTLPPPALPGDPPAGLLPALPVVGAPPAGLPATAVLAPALPVVGAPPTADGAPPAAEGVPAAPGLTGEPATPGLPADARAPAAPGETGLPSEPQPDQNAKATSENSESTTELPEQIIELRIAMAPSPAQQGRKGRTRPYHVNRRQATLRLHSIQTDHSLVGLCLSSHHSEHQLAPEIEPRALAEIRYA